MSTASHHSNNQNNLVWDSYFWELAFTGKPTEILYYCYLQDSSSKELSFLLSLSLKRFSQKGQSPRWSSHSSDSCFHFLLLSWGRRGGGARPPAGQVPQPPHRRWGTQCWHWPAPLQTSLARRAHRLHAAPMRALTVPSVTVTSPTSPLPWRLKANRRQWAQWTEATLWTGAAARRVTRGWTEHLSGSWGNGLFFFWSKTKIHTARKALRYLAFKSCFNLPTE